MPRWLAPPLVVASLLVLGAASSIGACKRDESTGSGGSGASSVSTSTGFEEPESPICGDEVHQAVSDAPLLYFVLDASGSMSVQAGGGKSRFLRVREGARDVTDRLGSLVRVGAAVYPLEASEAEPCASGDEVLGPRAGGSTAATKLFDATEVDTFGGTPTAAALASVRARLGAVPGQRVVLLATDGGPNCNFDSACTPEQCIPNIEGSCPADVENCCVDPGTPGNCLDRAATLKAVSDLAADGITVYVIGIPGSELYGTLLDQMAIIGGGAQQDAPTRYYRIDDLGSLGDIFAEIGAALVSCTFDLADPPEGLGLTNVYFDESVVLQDDANGWIWVDGDTIELVGAACEELRSGTVSSVQIVSGCPTEVPL
jgi:hypothetical protein